MKNRLLYLLFILLSSCGHEHKRSSHIAMRTGNSSYGLICIDETEKDTLLLITIDFETDSVQLSISNQIDLGVEMNLNWQDDSKFYEMSMYKLKKPIGGNYRTKLQNSVRFFPSRIKKNALETFANASLHIMQKPDSTFFTPDNDGFGDNVESALFDLSWFPDFQGHDYTIIEYYQDTKESWVNFYRK